MKSAVADGLLEVAEAEAFRATAVGRRAAADGVFERAAFCRRTTTLLDLRPSGSL